MDEDEFSVQPTPHGVLFSRFMVRFESMKAIMEVSENHGTRSVFQKEDLESRSWFIGIREHAGAAGGFFVSCSYCAYRYYSQLVGLVYVLGVEFGYVEDTILGRPRGMLE